MRDHEIIRRFLLGELREERAERVEKRLLEDDELFDLCEAVEAELLDAAARGELAPAERERVLKRLASSPQGRARLALAQGLAAEVARQRTSAEALPAPLPFRRRPAFAGRPAVRWAVAAGLALLLGGTWLLVEETGPEPEVRTARQEPAPQPPVGRTPQEVPRKRPAPPVASSVPPASPSTEPTPGSPERVAEEGTPTAPIRKPVTEFFELALMVLRSEEAEPEQISISDKTGLVELGVDVTEEETEEGLTNYDAEIWSGDVEVWKKKRVEPRPMDGKSFLVLDVPASAIPPGSYRVKIFGNFADGIQHFVRGGLLEVSRGE